MKLTTEQQLQIMDTCEIDQEEMNFWMNQYDGTNLDEYIEWIFQSQLDEDINEMMDGLGLT